MWPCKKSGGKSSLCGRTEGLCISYRIVSISKHLSVSYTQSTLCRCPPCLTRYPLTPPLPDQPVALPVPVGAHSQRCAVLGAFAALPRLRPLHGDPFCLPRRRAVEIVGPLAAEIAHDVADALLGCVHAVALVGRVHAVELTAPRPLNKTHCKCGLKQHSKADTDRTQIFNAMLPAFPPFLFPTGYGLSDG